MSFQLLDNVHVGIMTGSFSKSSNISDVALNNAEVPENKTNMDISKRPTCNVIKPKFNRYGVIYSISILLKPS